MRSTTATALFLVLGISSETNALVIVHDNAPATFVWLPTFGSATPHFLDVTRGPGLQGDADPRSSLVYQVPEGGGSNTPQPIGLNYAPDNMRVARSILSVSLTNPQGVQFETFPARVFGRGELVDTGASYELGTSVGWRALFATPQFIPLLGQRATVGFRVTLDSVHHFGFVDLEYRDTPLLGGGVFPMYQPIRWTYETEPNVPITVPAPVSTVALLELAVITPRRRRSA